MPEEQDVQRWLDQLGNAEPSEQSVRAALDRTRDAIESKVHLSNEQNRRSIMLVRIAAVVLVLIVVSSAVGGYLFVANMNDDRQQPSELVSPEKKSSSDSPSDEPKKDSPGKDVVEDKDNENQIAKKPVGVRPPENEKPNNETPERVRSPRKWTVADFADVSFVDTNEEAVSRGKHLFAKARCAECHDTAGKATKLGPTLAELAKRFTGEKLVAKVLDPAREINEGYKMHVFIMSDGRVHSGIILNQFEGAYDVLTDLRPPGKVTVVNKSEIEEMRLARHSPMPIGLFDRLTKNEIRDLVAFVGANAPKPAEVVKKDDDNEPEITQSYPKMDMQWGTLSGRFVFLGDIPEPKAIVPTKDVAFCGKHKIVDESLVVNQKNGGIQNLIVYLYLKKSDAKPIVHPCYTETEKSKVVVDNRGCRFEPHVTLLRTTQTLQVLNSDLVAHNARIDTINNPPISPLIPVGNKLEQQFGVAEVLPSPLNCNIHPWMKGWVVIKDNPYMAVTDKNGYFQITNLPPGEWTFRFWHERQGYIQAVSIKGKRQDWRLGRVTKTITPGENRMGEILTKIDGE